MFGIVVFIILSFMRQAPGIGNILEDGNIHESMMDHARKQKNVC